MRELSLNIMDVVQNSITAKASLVELEVMENTIAHTLQICIKDNGCGMDAKTLESVQSPFFSTRTTRSIGMGIPLFKMACEMTGGSFAITSALGEGTVVTARFHTDHIDMVPLGDVGETVLLLVTCNPDIDFCYTRVRDDLSFTLDTRDLREILGPDITLNDPEVVGWIRDFLRENHQQFGH